jgi:hypothetical protein
VRKDGTVWRLLELEPWATDRFRIKSNWFLATTLPGLFLKSALMEQGSSPPRFTSNQKATPSGVC